MIQIVLVDLVEFDMLTSSPSSLSSWSSVPRAKSLASPSLARARSAIPSNKSNITSSTPSTSTSPFVFDSSPDSIRHELITLPPPRSASVSRCLKTCLDLTSLGVGVGAVPLGRADPVMALDFSNDGRCLLIQLGAPSNLLLRWDWTTSPGVSTITPLGPTPTHGNPIPTPAPVAVVSGLSKLLAPSVAAPADTFLAQFNPHVRLMAATLAPRALRVIDYDVVGAHQQPSVAAKPQIIRLSGASASSFSSSSSSLSSSLSATTSSSSAMTGIGSGGGGRSSSEAVGAYSYSPLYKVIEDEFTCLAFGSSGGSGGATSASAASAASCTLLVGGASGRVYIVLDMLHVQTITLPAPLRSLSARHQVILIHSCVVDTCCCWSCTHSFNQLHSTHG